MRWRKNIDEAGSDGLQRINDLNKSEVTKTQLQMALQSSNSGAGPRKRAWQAGRNMPKQAATLLSSNIEPARLGNGHIATASHRFELYSIKCRKKTV